MFRLLYRTLFQPRPAMPTLVEFTTVSMMPSPSRSRNNRYSMLMFAPEQASVPVMQRSVGSSHRSWSCRPLSHQYISFHRFALFGVFQFWFEQSGTT